MNCLHPKAGCNHEGGGGFNYLSVNWATLETDNLGEELLDLLNDFLSLNM